MKKLTLLGALALIAASIGAQSPAPAAEDQGQVAALVQEVRAQQLQMADNQAKIDAKLVSLGEAIRIARIYASRGGR